MRAPRNEAVSVDAPADAAFEAALGVIQNTKAATLLAAHNTGRHLVFREKGKLSNPKFFLITVQDQGNGSVVNITAGTDDRSPKAMLDGKMNDKALKKFIERLHGALGGSDPAPATPVSNHYLQKKTEVPWEDPSLEPQIELDGNFLALYGR